MKGKQNKSDKENRYVVAAKRTRIIGTIFVCVAFIAALFYLLFMFMHMNIDNSVKTSEAMNLQLQTSLTQHLAKLENTAKIVFTHNEYISYDAAAVESSQNRYDSLQLEKEMKNYLTSLSLMDNYNDFAFVYRNNHTSGKISQGTLDLYGDDLYNNLRGELTEKNIVWVTGFNDDFSRLYYIRSVNQNIIFIGSFYAEDLHSIFSYSPEVSNISVVLTDEQGRIIYKVNENDKTQKAIDVLNNEWSADTVTITTARSDEFTASTADCATSWHITTVMDISSYKQFYSRIIVTCLCIMAAGVLVAVIIKVFASSFSDPDNLLFRAEFSTAPIADELTGLPTEDTVENAIADKIETCITGSTIALVLVRINNLQLIRENYGEETVNEAILNVAAILSGLFSKNDIVGKTGENEFILFADYTEFNLFKSGERMKANLRQLENELENCELDNSRGYVKCVMGVAVYPDDSSDYDVLYERARTAVERCAEKNIGCQYYRLLSDDEKQDSHREGET